MIGTSAGDRMRQLAVWSMLFSYLGMSAPASMVPQPLAAQIAGAASAVAQPRFTHIFGSDSMNILSPVLSPNGRWIVFIRQQGSDTFNLWGVPANGGVPVQLTSGRYRDSDPRWFQSGERIVFASNRPTPPGEGSSYIMVIPFDPRTGRTTGPAQQVTPESGFFPAVSPDGRWIAFFSDGAAAGIRRLVVTPSTGGTARTVFEERIDGSAIYAYAALPEWSPDGRQIYFSARLRGSSERAVLRVPAEGGGAERLWLTPRRISRLNTTARQVLTRPVNADLSGTEVAQVSTFGGSPIASIRLHRNMHELSFTGDGRSVLAVVSDVVAPIRVVPVAGGLARTLTEAREYDELDTWTADASRLAVRTRVNGRATLVDIPIDGGQAAEIATPLEATRTMLSSDRNHLFYVVTDPVTSRKSLRIRRLSDGRTREIAPDLFLSPEMSVAGPGGSPFSGEELLYFEHRGDRFELRSCAPDGEPRLLRSFTASFAGHTGLGVHGERFAWIEETGDSSALVLAEGPNGAPQRVAVVQGRLLEPVWSPDGRWVAAYLISRQHSAVFVVDATSGGQPSPPPRLIEAGLLSGWNIKWLPDSRAVTVLGMVGQGNTTDIWLISLREGDPPVNMTRDDPSTMWDYSLSRDGRYLAYPAELSRGSSIWRIDLPR